MNLMLEFFSWRARAPTIGARYADLYQIKPDHRWNPCRSGGTSALSVVIAQGITVASQTAGIRAIFSTGSGQGAFINGYVAAQNTTAIQLEGPNATVSVSATGVVQTIETWGDAISCFAFSLVELGTVLNHGLITRDAGIQMPEGNVLNTGTIQSVDLDAIRFTGFNVPAIVTNSGTIARLSPGDAIDGSSGSLRLSNNGTIIGNISGSLSTNVFTNSGLIHGDLAISLLTAAINTGAAAGDRYAGIEGLVGGAGNDFIIGDTAANFPFGSGGNDFIDGREGNDHLNGGAGDDRFRFATAIGAGNIDTIADFQMGVDDILLARTIFAAIGTGLTADAFRIGAAVDANEFLPCNAATRVLTCDSNGNVAGGATQVATLTTGRAVTIAEFVMV